MPCLSTRGGSPAVSAMEALLLGAAPDGGLYLPESLPNLESLLDEPLPYPELAGRVFAALLDGFPEEELREAARLAYAGQFEHPEITPLRQVGGDYILELFHGPTAAFKDLALQTLPRLMSAAAGRLRPGTRTLVLAATSGDTGSAAMRGFLGVPGFYTLVYYPANGVSPIQRLQMTRMRGANVKAVGISGDFDDAQRGVKAAFQAGNAGLPGDLRLSSANSINYGRLVPQIVYYIKACADLQSLGALTPGQNVDFLVPSGNFGDILAGYLAKRLGFPVGRLACAVNRNRVLADFLETGVYDRRRALYRTASPSMDILVSSNLERLLYYASGGDAGRVASLMAQLAGQGHYAADEDMMRHIRGHFTAYASDDREAAQAIHEVFEDHHYLMDPHTAAGWLARQALPKGGNPRVVLATASPFKFPETMLGALGAPLPKDPERAMAALCELSGRPLPRSLSGLMGSGESNEAEIGREDIPADVLRRAAAWQ